MSRPPWKSQYSTEWDKKRRRTHQTFSLCQDATLGLFDILLTTSDLNFGLLVSDNLLFLAALLVFLVSVIKDIDLDAKEIAKPVDTSTLRAHNPSYKFTVDVELGGLRSSQSALTERYT